MGTTGHGIGEIKVGMPYELSKWETNPMVDHGLILAHELGGKPKHWVHEVSIPAECRMSALTLQDHGYKRTTGWMRSGRQMWVWLKTYAVYTPEIVEQAAKRGEVIR